MSKEFEQLQFLIKSKKCELKLKRHIKDMFGVWLHGISTTRPSLWNFFGYAGGIYMFLFSWIVWTPVALFVGYKYGWIYFFVIFIPYLVKIILRPVGQGFLLADLQINEDLFNALWDRKAIGICSVKKRESAIHKDGVPEIIVDSYNQNWQENINKFI